MPGICFRYFASEICFLFLGGGVLGFMLSRQGIMLQHGVGVGKERLVGIMERRGGNIRVVAAAVVLKEIERYVQGINH